MWLVEIGGSKLDLELISLLPLTSYSAMGMLANEASDVPIAVQPIDLVFIDSMIAERGNTI